MANSNLLLLQNTVSDDFPILSYNSEIWGLDGKDDFKVWDNTPTEKTHLKFCKQYLDISKKAIYVASRSELGQFSVIINIYKSSYSKIRVEIKVIMYVCMYVCMYGCMYVCMYVCVTSFITYDICCVKMRILL